MFIKRIFIASSLLMALIGTVSAASLDQATSGENPCLSDKFLTKNDARFAYDCAEFAFGAKSTIEDRQLLAWMLFARLNQPIVGIDATGNAVRVPKWMAWPTDNDTFKRASTRFEFEEVADISKTTGVTNISKTSGFVTPKHVLASGSVSNADPDGSNEQVTRNKTSYDYLYYNKLNTIEGVKAYLTPQDVTRIEMPIGSIEIKGSWLKSNPNVDKHFPTGTFSFEFDDGKYWFRGMHIMVKLAKLDASDNVFSSENPSWFWTTFELNNNPGGAACTDETPKPPEKCTTTDLNASGTEHVRETFITQRAPFDKSAIAIFLESTGLGGMGFENYAPNGTQVRFTENADGQNAVTLGHTDMEDFAGGVGGQNTPDTHQNPAKWDKFHASCHTCHATAAYNPETGYVYPFTVKVGILPKNYTNKCNLNKESDTEKKFYNADLANGYKSLDFMWPIAFQLDFKCKMSKPTG